MTASALPVPITALYAGLLALLLVLLALRVVRLRWKFRVGLGDGGERAMTRAIRVHGNATEHVPIALLLLHAVGLGKSAGASWQRAAGTVGTLGVIVMLAAVDVAAFLR